MVGRPVGKYNRLISELDARRFAPCNPVQEDSPKGIQTVDRTQTILIHADTSAQRKCAPGKHRYHVFGNIDTKAHAFFHNVWKMFFESASR